MSVRFGQFCGMLAAAVCCLLAACQTQQQQNSGSAPAGQDASQLTPPPVGNATPARKAKPGRKKYQPVQVGPYVPKAPGRRVACVSVPGPYVALTFDDGPNPATTPRILDILKAHGVHATFFVAGENAARNKSILARAAAEGHEIGAHTYTHINLKKSSDDRILSEMTRTNNVIIEATGRRPVVMRPPYGSTSPRIVDMMYDEYGMTSILWDVDTQDWKHPGVSVVVDRAVKNARPGSIILVHDIHASTADAIEDIVVGLQERGFILVTVSELLELAGQSPAPAPGTPAGGEGAETPASEPASAQDAPEEHGPGEGALSA